MIVESASVVWQLEVKGFAVLPGFLAAATLGDLKSEFAELDLIQARKDDTLSVYREVHFSRCGTAIGLLADGGMLRVLRQVLGERLICTASSYARYGPGYPGMPLHTDCQPYGSKLFGPLASVPVSLRVFYYLDELTATRCPLRVVPSSHLCLHQECNPYRRFSSHPEELALTGVAGTAIVINPKVFHGVGPNRTAEPRSVYTAAYRPEWAGPARRVPRYDRAKVSSLPQPVRQLFQPPNRRVCNPRMPVEDRGDNVPPLGPARWSSPGGAGEEIQE